MSDIEDLLRIESTFCSWGDTVHYNDPPKIFIKSHGHYLIDTKDRVYLDMQTSHSSVNFGYGNSAISSHFLSQLNKMPMLASEFLSIEKIQLSKMIVESIKEWTQTSGRVHYNVGGAQAIDDALKLIATNTGKRMVFSFEGGYHGRSIAALNISSSYRYRQQFGHFSNRSHFIPYPYCFRCPYNMSFDKCKYYCIKQFERLFENEYCGIINAVKDKVEYSAFVIEPVQGTGGYICPPKDYFKKLKDILDQFGILLVDDEIHMGLYRTGKMWAFEHFNIKPDIVVFGKSLTNGLNPLSGFWAKEELVNPIIWPPGSTHSTFGSNPLGMAAGIGTLEYLKSFDIEKSVSENGKYFLNELKLLEKEFSEIGNIDGIGLALRIELCQSDGYTPNSGLAQRLKYKGLIGNLRSNFEVDGVILNIGGRYKNVIILAPPLTIKKQEIDLFISILNYLLESDLNES